MTERWFAWRPVGATHRELNDTGCWLTWVWRKREMGRWAYYTHNPDKPLTAAEKQARYRERHPDYVEREKARLQLRRKSRKRKG